MNWLSNEILFYGGAAAAIFSVAAAFVYFCFSRISAVRLNAKLDAEYGEKGKKKKRYKK